MKWAYSFSAGLHTFGPALLVGLFLAIAFILSFFFDIDWMAWLKPKPTEKDIEFVITQNTNANRPDEATLRGAFNQEAGGETDPTEKIQPLEDPVQQAAQASQTPIPAQTARQQSRQTAQQATQRPQQRQKKPPTPKRKPAPLPSVLAMKDDILDSSTSSYRPSTPTQSRSASRSSSSSAGRTGANRKASANSRFNPQSGKSQRPGAAVKQADFGAYMADVKRRIKRNWNPPKKGNSKKVEIAFYLNRSGRLTTWRVKRSSGDPGTDRSAIDAIKLSAPFRPLPPEYPEKTLLIEFTFDYNVIARM